MTFTGAHHMVTSLQYVEETAKGTFPTNPALNYIAPEASLAITDAYGDYAIWELEGENIRQIVQGPNIAGIQVTFTPYNLALLKYAFNTGAANREKTLSLYWKETIGGTTIYWTASFAMIANATLVGAPGAAAATVNFICKQPVASTSTPLGSGSEATDPGTTIFHDRSSGWNFTWGGATPNLAAVTINVNNDLNPIIPANYSTIQDIVVGQHIVSGRLAVYQTGTVWWGYHVNHTEGNMIWIPTTGSTITGATCYLSGYQRTTPVGGGPNIEYFNMGNFRNISLTGT